MHGRNLLSVLYKPAVPQGKTGFLVSKTGIFADETACVATADGTSYTPALQKIADAHKVSAAQVGLRGPGLQYGTPAAVATAYWCPIFASRTTQPSRPANYP